LAILLFGANQLQEQIFLQWFAPNGFTELCQLDCHWYTNIASQGYENLNLDKFDFSRKANLAFFPLFPLIGHLLSVALGLSTQTAILLTGKLFFFLSILAFMRLGVSIAPNIHPAAIGSIAAFNPYSIYGNAGYTESLYLFVTSIFFILLLRKSILGTAVAGALLSSIRLVGVVSLFSTLMAWAPHWMRWPLRMRIKAAAGIAVIPSGLLLFMLHLYLRTGDPLAFIHIQKSWGRATPTSIISLTTSLANGLTNEWWMYRYWALSGLCVLLISLIFILAKRHTAMATFSFLSTLIPLSSDCWGLARYIWWQAPVLLFIACLVCRRQATLTAWLLIAFAINTACYRQWFSSLDWHIS
jgi:hypothetical protein